MAIYEDVRANRKVGAITQSQVDRLLEMQDKLDEGQNPWQ